MRILHIIVSLSSDGAQIMLKRLIESDSKSAPDTIVVSLTSLDGIGKSLRDQGVMLHALNMSSALGFPAAIWRLVKLIRKYKPDIVQTWMYHADFLGGLAARMAGNKNIVWGVHTSFLSIRTSAGTIMLRKACALLSRWVPKKIVLVAESAKKTHVSIGYDESIMVVIPNGFDFSCFFTTKENRILSRESFSFFEKDFVVGCVGRFHPDKGQKNFIKAAAIVARTHLNVKFLLVGRGCDSSNSKLMGWLNRYSMEDRCILLGERKDVAGCLAAMDVFCMPSRFETFPVALGEAMLMGLPCVATDVGDTAILTGDTVILVSPQDEQSLASGILRVLDLSNEKRYQMGQRAKLHVMNEFSIEKTRERFEVLYREILSEARR